MKEPRDLKHVSKKTRRLKGEIVSDIRSTLADMRKENTHLRMPEGQYFRIIVRPRETFNKFKAHTISVPGGVQKISGRQLNGHWSTHAWLISKSAAHRSKNILIGDTQDAKHLLRSLGSKITFTDDDILVVR